jgi:HlyD family secretion protein
VRNLEKQVERQQLVVAESRRRVEELTLISPVTGVVGSTSVDPRDIVTRNQEILTVIDLTAFEITISIPESYADEIATGNTAEITYENAVYPGSVVSISPEVNNSLVEGRVVFSGELPRGLKQNQRVTTRIILSTKTNVLTVRRGPFVESGGGRKAYRVEGNIAKLVAIAIGETSLTEVEVISGLAEGETIVISDTARFQNAETVLLR